MSGYEYQNWWQYLYNKHKGDLSAYVAASQESPDPNDFLDHQRKQFIEALEAETTDERWTDLLVKEGAARTALQSGQVNRIAIAFCDLGQAIERVQHPSMEERLRLLTLAQRGCELENIERKRQAGNIKKAKFIEVAQELAASCWADDTGQAKRLGAMCDHIYKKMLPFDERLGGGFLPGESEGLKPWLRPVAPDYATKGGRTKK